MSDHDTHKLNSYRTGPDEQGHFGIFGGRYVAETLMPLILDLEKAYNTAKADPAFSIFEISRSPVLFNWEVSACLSV